MAAMVVAALASPALALEIVDVFSASSFPGLGCVRIPLSTVAADGTLLAVAEGRLGSCSDSTKKVMVGGCGSELRPRSPGG